MKEKIIGALSLLAVGLLVVFSLWYLLPVFLDKQQKTSSDAAKTKGKIILALDNWIGYFPLRSPEMKSQMRKAGWMLLAENDNADYLERMKRLKKGEIDMAVATVDSYLLSGVEFDFPATIVMVIDESKGGDAILARSQKISSLDALKGKTDIKIAFTPSSPSHYLAKAAADHFNVPELLPSGANLIETEGSEVAREKLISGDADVAILWEPDVSKALEQDGITKILGTEDTEKLIVDIFLIRRQFTQDHPEVVNLFMSTYFRVLKKYRENKGLLHKHVIEETDLSNKTIDSMLSGVKWVTFMENCEKWFGVASPGTYAEEGLIDSIESTISTLKHAGDFRKNPIPDGDPYRITNSTFLETLFAKGVIGFTTPNTISGSKPTNSLEAFFPLLDENGWAALREVGTLKVEPIIFQHGSTSFNLMSKQVIDNAVSRLKHYPNFRILIKGHTGTRGDLKANLRLSQDRAEAVSRYLKVTYNINANRLRAIGYGGTKPLPRKAGESKRSFEYRLPRVEMVLVREEY